MDRSSLGVRAMLGGDGTWAPKSPFRMMILGLLLLATGASAGAAEAPAADSMTHLVGTVLDASGKPAAGAVIGILADPNVNLKQSRSANPLYVTADAAGRFDLAVPRSLGTATVVARRAGSLSAKSASIPLKAPRQDVPALQLGEGLKFTGRVVDEQRRPIPAATVQAVAEDSRIDTTRGSSQTVRAQTQRDGSFELAGLDVGGVTLAAYSRSHALWTKQGHQLDASAGSRRLEIVLKKGVYLAGTVLDVQGQPIPGVTVSTSQFSSLTEAKSDASGRFRIGPFEAGQRQSIDAQLVGYTPFRDLFTAPRADLVFVLNRNAVLRGRVVDGSSNQPLQSFQVSVHSPKGGRGELRHESERPRTFNSRDGRFELPNLYTGPWTISVQARGYQSWESVDFEFQGGVTHDLAITLNQGVTLRGRIIDKASGKPLSGALLSFELKPRFFNESLPNRPATSDAKGMFVLEGVPPGSVTVSARLQGYLPVIEKVSTDTQTLIELAATRGASIRGQVVAADGVTPIKASIALQQGRSPNNYSTDAQGRFEIAQRDPGRYRVAAMTDTARSEAQEVTLAEGQEVSGLILRLTPAASVRGRVSGVPPAELSTASVIATDLPSDGFERLYRMPSDGRRGGIELGGAYLIQGLSGGEQVIGARMRFSGIVKKVVVPERGEAAVDFDFGDVQITGRVTRNGKPAAGVGVFARPLEGQSVAAVGTTTATGEYSLSNLARGRYSVAAFNAKSVQVNVGGGIVQNFELDDPFVISGRAVDAGTGQGLAEVALQLAPLTAGGTTIVYFGSPSTNRQGEFSLPQIKAGDYRLILFRPGYDIAEQRISVKDNVSGLEFELRRVEGVRLRVRTADDGVIYGVRVREQVSDDSGINLSMRLDQYGSGGLPPSLVGRTLSIEHGDYAPHSVERWNGAPLDIELRPLETR